MSEFRVIFDLDDTLYPERDFARSGFAAVDAWAVDKFSVQGLGPAMLELLDAGHRGNLFGMALMARRPDASAADIAMLHDVYRAHAPTGLALFDDGAWALEHYARQSALGLITDGHVVMQSSKVRGLRIAHRFREIIYTDTLAPGRAMAKPHARAFEVMAATLARPGDRFVYVGDNPSKDFVAPNALGWISVWIDRRAGIHHGAPVADGGAPQHTIRSLRELPGVLGS